MALTKAPQFLGPDGAYRDRYIFTTDRTFRFFTGSMDADTVDMRVAIRGASATSNPDLILFEGTTFTIPNPASYPEGLQLFPGDNHIEVISVLSNGATTPAGTIDARLSVDRDVRVGITAPSGVSVERLNRAVRVTVDGLSDASVTGYNFYASTSPGGGTTGYFQINPTLVTDAETEETLLALGSLEVDSSPAKDQDGSYVANPLLLRVIGTQVDKNGTVIQTDFNQEVPIRANVGHLRTGVTVSSVRIIQRVSFTHDRKATSSSHPNPAIPHASFSVLQDNDPLYYVGTAVYFIDGREYESALSPEVAAYPLVVTPAVSDLPVVSRDQIVRDMVLATVRSHPELDVKPGSVIRDTVIDPFSTEAERVRFIIGFLQLAQSFTTLLSIDDPGLTGASVPVAQSPYKVALKQAFFLQTDVSVQNMIDNAFDHLAARRGVQRRTGVRSRGEVTLYFRTRPSSTVGIPIGMGVAGGGSRFRITSAAHISPSGTNGFSAATGRWSTRAFVQAENPGAQGNLSRGQITAVVNGPNGLQVVNESRLFGGRSDESNLELATRADGVLSSVDSGTYRGYAQHAVDVPGVMQVNVVDAGHELMMRDLDSGRHIGGKVDVWVRGDQTSTVTDGFATVTDGFAFSFRMVKNGQFEPIGDLDNLKFRAVNADITVGNPIIEMLDVPSWGYEFKSISGDGVTRVLSLEGATLVPPDGIQLSADFNDPALLHLTDEFRGSYRFRTGNRHVFNRQPVTSIRSFRGEVTGLVTPSAYRLFHESDPLDLGGSAEAGDYIQVVIPTDGSVVGVIPSGDPLVITREAHVVLGGPEYLLNLGVNPLTVRVYSLADNGAPIYYVGPYNPLVDGDRDFTFVAEDGENPLAFMPTSGSNILEGMTVYADYEHDENFTVEYETNSLVGIAQSVIDGDRHVTADVVTKGCLAIGVDISGTVVLRKQRRNRDFGAADADIRNALAQFFGSLSLGDPVRQSDIVQVLDAIPDVSYVVVPLVKLARQDGSVVLREPLVTTEEDTDWVRIPAWGPKVFLLTQRLKAGTLHGGGLFNDFRGVFLDDVPMALLDTPPDFNGEPLKQGGAFIIGNDGLTIPGITSETARRVLVAFNPKDPSTPSDHHIKVTYVAYGDTGTNNIEPGPTGFLELGDVEFALDEDKDFAALVAGRKG